MPNISEILTAMDKKIDALERQFLQETFTFGTERTFTLQAAPHFVFEVVIISEKVYTLADYTVADNVLTVTSPLAAGDKINVKYVTGKILPLPAYTVGTGAGGCLIRPAFNPLDPNNIFISCDMSSAFVSHDGGETFVSTPTWGTLAQPQWFFNPHDENIVYAFAALIGTVIYMSPDKGRTWTMLTPKPEELAGIAYSHWGALEQVAAPIIKTGAFVLPYISSLYVSPTDANTIFVSTRGVSEKVTDGKVTAAEVTAKIYRSTDAGSTWSILFDLEAHVPSIGTLFPNRGIADLMLAYSRMLQIGDALYLLNNAGLFSVNVRTQESTRKLFTNSNGVLQEDAGQPVVTVVADHTVEFAAPFVNQVIRSTDFGTTWTNLTEGFIENLRTPEGLTMAEHQLRNNVEESLHINFLFLGASGSTLYVSFYGGGWRSDGMAKTSDNGKNWLFTIRGTHNSNYADTFLSMNPLDTVSGSTGGAGMAGRGLAVDPSNADRVIMTNMGDAMMSVDGGVKWRSLSSRRTDSGNMPKPADNQRPFWTTRGLEPSGMHVLAVDPFDTNHRFTGWTDCGTYETFDGGKTWGLATYVGGVQKLPYWNCHAIAFDPHHAGVVLVAVTPKQTIHASTGLGLVNVTSTARIGTLCRSTDNGVNWTRSDSGTATEVSLSDPTNSGLPTCSLISDIVFDPMNEDVVYASVSGAGVYKSTDGGISWVPFNNGIALQSNEAKQQGILPYRLVLGQDKQTLFLLLHDNGTDKHSRTAVVQRCAPTYSLNLKTQATTWQEITRPGGATSTMLTSLDMTKDGTLYATAALRLIDWDAEPFNGGLRYRYECGGAYVSTDRGATWRQMYDPTMRASCIKVESRNNNILYMATHHGKVYVSCKGKDTTAADWKEIPGFNYYAAQRIFEDPQDMNRIFITTVGGGTWSLPTNT